MTLLSRFKLLLKQYHCPVCQTNVEGFEPISPYYVDTANSHDFIYSFKDFETLNLEHYTCPNCKSSDRDRLYALFFSQLHKTTPVSSMLDFAPAKAIEAFLRSRVGKGYRSTDLNRKDVDDSGVNIEDMSCYADNSFDFIICSHILEHVASPKLAVSELNRVLKVGSKAIIMVPIMTTIENDTEDSALVSEASRWKHYGQDDHVRMFSKNGFVALLKSAGFQVSLLTKSDFKNSNFIKLGIDPKSVLYVVTK